MKWFPVLCMSLLLLLPGTAGAVEVAGVNLAPQVEIAGQNLQLNGYGIRKKLFFKIYIGSLYTTGKVSSTEAVLAAPGPKLIRMDFLYGKVEKEKITEAFAEGLKKNAPSVATSSAAQTFLGWFRNDFVKGDQVDLQVLPDGTVNASQNGKPLGSLNDPALGQGILLIYLGKEPADDDMKAGMLGG